MQPVWAATLRKLFSHRTIVASQQPAIPVAWKIIVKKYGGTLGREEAFDKELKSLIFSHVSEDQKLGTEYLGCAGARSSTG